MMRKAGAGQGPRLTLWSLPRLMRFEKRAVVAIVLLLVGRALLLLVIPWPLKIIVDSVIYRKPLWGWLAPFVPDPATDPISLLTLLSIFMLALGAAENVLSYHGERLLLITGQRAVFELRSKVFAHLQRLSLAFHRRQKIGDLMSKLGGDIQRLQDFVVNIGAGMFSHLLVLAGMAGILLKIDWLYGLIVFSTVLPLIWVTQYYSRRVKASLRHARKQEGKVWSIAQETLSAIQLVQAYGREAFEEKRFRSRVDKSLGSTLEASSLQLQLPRVVGFVFAAGTAAALWLGAVEVLNGAVTAGELLICLAYLRGMATPIRQIAKTVGTLGKAEVAGERIAELLAETTDVKEAVDAISPRSCAGELEFRSVCFAYGPERDVLTEVSFRILKGQMIALVGATGAGKSTIASLIPRFHDPARGQILLDGIDLRRLSLSFLRGQMALVTQEPILFSGAVWENIAYGRLDADRNAAIAAARGTGVHDLIEQLPAGYDTRIGERGATLSGGQRQYISFARAMLRNAPIVILDEPTSGLDAVAEFRLGQALKRLTTGRTTLIIAHRLTTIAAADLILVIDQGRIVQSGTHEQLLRSGGRYAEFWHRGGNVLRDEAPHANGLL